jgi:exodeoxyribonuclease VII small subunit
MESGNGSLEENIQWFDEGIKLIEVCRKELTDSEKKIDELIKNVDGSLILKNIK